MKTCIITGASQGIGRAAAIRLSQETDVGNIVLVARSEAGLQNGGRYEPRGDQREAGSPRPLRP